MALHDLGLVERIDKNIFFAKISANPSQSVIKILKEEFSIKVNKVELAGALAGVLIGNCDIWQSDEFWASEIGKFLDSIRRLP